MGKAKKTRKFAVAKRVISPKDARLKSNQTKDGNKSGDSNGGGGKDGRKNGGSLPTSGGNKARHVDQAMSALFFQYNTQLGPPYHVLIDTNFINFSIRNKMDVIRSMMDCLLAKCVPCVTDCVMGELERLGSRYGVALRLAKDPRFERVPCGCRGCYADDCLVNMVTNWRCFIVATCDRELRGRIRKIPGVPCMYISSHRYTVERMPEAFGAPR
jgi:U3 small nucleolar RNA-associated protein 24